MTDTPASIHSKTLIETLEAMAAESAALDAANEARENAGFSLREILDRLDDRAFGAALFLLALPCCVPFLWGIPQIVSLPMMALAVQMTAGRSEPWLPEKFADRKMSTDSLQRTARGGRKWMGWVETFAKPRLEVLTGKRSERIIGAILCVFCASILLPIPGTNTVPGMGVALASFGLMARDGVLVLLGLIVGTAWISFLLFSLAFGASFLAG